MTLQPKPASSLCTAGRGRGQNDITGGFKKVRVIQQTWTFLTGFSFFLDEGS